MGIFNKTVQDVMDGLDFNVDLERKTLRVGNKLVIENGEVDKDKLEKVFTTSTSEHALQMLLTQYKKYKHSVPMYFHGRKKSKYFACVNVRDLTDEDIIVGNDRLVEQCKMELMMLLLVLGGSLKWNDKWGSFFCQSKQDKNLVLLKAWF